MVANPRDSATGFDYRWSVGEEHIEDVIPCGGRVNFFCKTMFFIKVNDYVT